MKAKRLLILVIALLGVSAYGASGVPARPGSDTTSTAIALGSGAKVSQPLEQRPNQVLEWNEIFVETLIATNTGELVEPTPRSNRSHGDLRCLQRDQAALHTDLRPERRRRRQEPRSSRSVAPRSSRCRCVHGARGPVPLSGGDSWVTAYAASLAALSDDGGDGGQSRERGIAWGTQVAQAVLAWRAGDGFSASYPAFTGGTAVGQWRPIAPATSMSAQGLAFTEPFVVDSNAQFRPDAPRTLASPTYAADFNAVKALGRRTGSTRSEAQTALAPFWEGNASVHWNQAANQIARANDLSMSDSNRLLAVLNIAMADTAFTIWSAKRHYGANPADVTWRPLTAITLADTDGIADDSVGSRLAPARRHTVPSGVSSGAPGPERRGWDRPFQPLCRRRDIHPDDLGPAQSDVHQHRASTSGW